MTKLPVAIVGLVMLASYPTPHAARGDADKIRVYNTPPAEPYEVIDTIVVEEDDLKEALEELREEAEDRDGDAVVVTFQSSSTGFWLNSEVNLAGDVIRFTKPKAKPKPPETPPDETPPEEPPAEEARRTGTGPVKRSSAPPSG